MTKRCLGCGQRTYRSYCATCQRRYDSAYNSTRKRARARATIAANPQCEQCGSRTDLTADHVVPVIDGGANGPLRVLCRSCNSRRGSDDQNHTARMI
jgi:5-methylcytosine-specific restriction endonuclease McrA